HAKPGARAARGPPRPARTAARRAAGAGAHREGTRRPRPRRRPQRACRACRRAGAAGRLVDPARTGPLHRTRADQGARRRLSPRSRSGRNRCRETRTDPIAMTEATDTTPQSNGKRRAILLAIAALFVLAGIAWYLTWRFVWSQREVTEDAYVAGNQVLVSAQVPGTVVAVLADDTQRVEAGQELVRLDPVNAGLALAKARSALA